MDDQCRQCGSPVGGEICPHCRAWPSLARSDRRFGTLALGLLSIPFGIALIPNVLAIRRAIGELREVARRERAGVSCEEHERARDDAVLGIALASIVPILVLATAVSWIANAADEGGLAYARTSEDELGEVLAYFSQNKQAHHESARRQLAALAPQLSDPEFDRALAGALDESQAWAVLHALFIGDPSRQERVLPRLRPVFARMPMQEQETLLDAIAGSNAPSAMPTFAALASGPLTHMYKPERARRMLRHTMPRAPYARFPFERLARRADAGGVLRSLLADRHHEYFDSALGLAAEWCRAGLAREALRALEPAYVRAVSEASCGDVWADEEAEAPSGRACTGEALVALGCMEGEASAALLRDGLNGGSPDLVIEAWLLRGEDVPDAAIAGVARRVDVRGELYLALARRGAESRFPPDLLTPFELARSEIDHRCSAEPRLRAQREVMMGRRRAHFVVLDCSLEGDDRELRSQFVVGPVVTRGLPPCETRYTEHVPTERGELLEALLGEAVGACRREATR